ncbi:MAG: aminotransferase class I/II-fold pyridoxal phosphate-dependent enzyme [Spirochaetes bacterium]|nr:aminotransferase class I/II-fold pyridoxal phosphate-dependent enzyme [Spirochaetota bacterium]
MSMRPFALERYFSRYEFSARYLLGSSDPESMSVEELLAFEPGSEEGLKRVWLGYTEYLGDPGLRGEISARYDSVASGQVVVFSGAEEPIFTFMNAVLEPGDHLIVHFPSYQSHYSVAESRGIQVSRWAGRPEDGWAPDPAELRALVGPRTKAILVCTPHNPTGYHFDGASLREVVSIARENGLILFSDEVYRGTEHDPKDRLPNVADLYERGISLNGLSKNCGLAGLRLGWVATRDAAAFGAMAAFKDYLTISNSAPGEYLARIAVRNMDALCERSRRLVAGNLDLLEAFFLRQERLFRWRRPAAGTTVFPEFLGGSSLSFCDRLVAETGIMLVPGTFFELEGEYIRFGYGRANFREVLPMLESYLDRNKTTA